MSNTNVSSNDFRDYSLDSWDHCNVLLLALSTFHHSGVMEENKFIWNDAEEYTGIYQLDPVPKMLSAHLKKQGEYLDKMILLCTDAVRNDRKKMKIEYLDGKSECIPGEPTALEYFKSKMRPYLNPDIEEQEQFIVVPVNEKKIEEGMAETIRIVRTLRNPRLYIDPHGGFREVSLVAEAVISLLKVEGIEVAGIYGIEHGQGKENKIVDGSAGFHIFDFVSGINEFINYGRANSLESFLKKSTRTDGKQENVWQNRLVRCIRTISEGIQLCNIPVFEGGLDELTQFFAAAERQGQGTFFENTYLSVFMENIRSDYGVLLTDQRTVVDEIEWCRRKGFYQQVLTLIESRIPGYLEETGVCSYHHGSKKSDAEVFNWCLPWRYHPYRGKDAQTRIQEMGQKWYPHREKLEGKRYVEDSAANSFIEIHIPEERKELLDQFLQMHVELKEIRNQSNHASDRGSNLSLAEVETKISEYLRILQKLSGWICTARIRKVTDKGNVMLEILSGMELEKTQQCVLKRRKDGQGWKEKWRKKCSEVPDAVYQVLFRGKDGPQFLFELAEHIGC